MDLETIRRDFPILKKVIYLDNAATTQTPVPVVEAMTDYFYNYAGNYGRGAHRLARETTARYENARSILAKFIDARPTQLIFTRNATEAINMVAHGIRWNSGDHIVTSVIEHHSNMLPWIRLGKKDVELSFVEPDKAGNINPQDIDSAITDRTRLVAISHVSNVLGSIQDVRKITQIAHRHGAPVLIDAAQSIGHMPVSAADIGCDYLCASGHKGLLGPQGTGFLYIRDPESLDPVYLGGGTVNSVTRDSYKLEPSPARFEAGTPNIPGVIGLGRAVEYVTDIGLENIERYVTSLAEITASRLSEIDKVQVYGPKNRAGIVSFNIAGLNPHDVAIILDETKNICVRSGHHCAIPCIRFIGIEGTARASFAAYTTEEEVEIFADTVEQIAKSLAV